MVRRWLKVCPGPYWQLTDCLLRTCRTARMGLRLARLSGKHDCKLRLTDVCPRHLDRDRSNHTSIWNHHATISRDINRARHFDSDRSNHEQYYINIIILKHIYIYIYICVYKSYIISVDMPRASPLAAGPPPTH